MAAHQVDDYRVAGRQQVTVRPLAEHGVRPRPAQRRVRVAGHGAARSAEHLAIVHFLVEAAKPQLSLVPRQPQHSLNLKLNLRLSYARSDQGRHRLRRGAHLAGGDPHPLQLPLALDRPRAPKRGGAVAHPPPLQARDVGQVAGGGQHVQLQPDLCSHAQAAAVQLAGQRRQRAQLAHIRQRRLLARPPKRAPHQQRRITLQRHDQVRLLVGAREVGEVGALDDHRAVQTVLPQLPSQAAQPSLDLLLWNHAA